jgi:hypothetical protein
VLPVTARLRCPTASPIVPTAHRAGARARSGGASSRAARTPALQRRCTLWLSPSVADRRSRPGRRVGRSCGLRAAGAPRRPRTAREAPEPIGRDRSSPLLVRRASGRAAHPRRFEGELISSALVHEVSVLINQTPKEPLTEVLLIEQAPLVPPPGIRSSTATARSCAASTPPRSSCADDARGEAVGPRRHYES